ncbi:TPA: PrgI family protein [Candidatus Saccharibacteria bacterium]|nr:PrgI family protein [Candidatus Saccharibacteria bacterium]HIO87830.1 PrgI family protein [Candidatus Saccharibacteria bacterium]
MGYYKVPQDVEAEDKLLGPFTFKQFVFLIVTIIAIFVAFQLVATVSFFAAIPLFPVIFVCGLIGVYRPKDQPVENKVIAYLNFWFRPRKRLWSRDGIVEQVTIKVPKKIETHLGDGRSQDQVRSQLKQLAQIVDTRGWATKRADLQEPLGAGLADDDRLIKPSEVTTVYDQAPEDVTNDDIYDDATNPVAQAFNQQTTQSEQTARDELIERLRNQASAVADQGSSTLGSQNYVNPYQTTSEQVEPVQPTQDDKALQQRIKELEQNQELSVSSIAARAQEMEIEHSTDSNELNIQH